MTCRSSACPRTSSRPRPTPTRPASPRTRRSPRTSTSATGRSTWRERWRPRRRRRRRTRTSRQRPTSPRPPPTRPPSPSRRPTTGPRPSHSMPAPPFVGLTGGIGAGKSEALAAFERLGAATISADAVVHELYRDPEVVAAVTGRWGDDVAPGGAVDRSAVAGRAFSDPDERAWLEGLLWPRVGRRIAAWRAAESARDPAPPALVVETPLLFEAGLEAGYDATVA